jgi:hypothetical protein
MGKMAAGGFEPYLILILAFIQLIHEAATVIIRRFVKAHFFWIIFRVLKATPTLTK